MRRSTYPTRMKGACTIHLVPYSEHSSYNELRTYVRWLKPKKVVPTVGGSAEGGEGEKQRAAMLKHFRNLVDENASKVLFLKKMQRTPSGGSSGFAPVSAVAECANLDTAGDAGCECECEDAAVLGDDGDAALQVKDEVGVHDVGVNEDQDNEKQTGQQQLGGQLANGDDVMLTDDPACAIMASASTQAGNSPSIAEPECEQQVLSVLSGAVTVEEARLLLQAVHYNAAAAINLFLEHADSQPCLGSDVAEGQIQSDVKHKGKQPAISVVQRVVAAARESNMRSNGLTDRATDNGTFAHGTANGHNGTCGNEGTPKVSNGNITGSKRLANGGMPSGRVLSNSKSSSSKRQKMSSSKPSSGSKATATKAAKSGVQQQQQQQSIFAFFDRTSTGTNDKAAASAGSPSNLSPSVLPSQHGLSKLGSSVAVSTAAQAAQAAAAAAVPAASSQCEAAAVQSNSSVQQTIQTVSTPPGVPSTLQQSQELLQEMVLREHTWLNPKNQPEEATAAELELQAVAHQQHDTVAVAGLLPESGAVSSAKKTLMLPPLLPSTALCQPVAICETTTSPPTTPPPPPQQQQQQQQQLQQQHNNYSNGTHTSDTMQQQQQRSSFPMLSTKPSAKAAWQALLRSPSGVKKSSSTATASTQPTGGQRNSQQLVNSAAAPAVADAVADKGDDVTGDVNGPSHATAFATEVNALVLTPDQPTDTLVPTNSAAHMSVTPSAIIIPPPLITPEIREAVLLPLARYDPISHACWSAGQPLPYLHIALAFAAVDSTTKRLKIADALTNMFRSIIALSAEDLTAAAYLACGMSDTGHQVLGVGFRYWRHQPAHNTAVMKLMDTTWKMELYMCLCHRCLVAPCALNIVFHCS